MLSVALVPHIPAHRTSIIVKRRSGKVTESSGIMKSAGGGWGGGAAAGLFLFISELVRHEL